MIRKRKGETYCRMPTFLMGLNGMNIKYMRKIRRISGYPTGLTMMFLVASVMLLLFGWEERCG